MHVCIKNEFDNNGHHGSRQAEADRHVWNCDRSTSDVENAGQVKFLHITLVKPWKIQCHICQSSEIALKALKYIVESCQNRAMTSRQWWKWSWEQTVMAKNAIANCHVAKCDTNGASDRIWMLSQSSSWLNRAKKSYESRDYEISMNLSRRLQHH